MEDITPAKDRGVLKKVIKQGTGQIVPDKAIVRGVAHCAYIHTCRYTHSIFVKVSKWDFRIKFFAN